MPEELKTEEPKETPITEPKDTEADKTKLTDFADKPKEPPEDTDNKTVDVHGTEPDKKITVEKPDGLPEDLWDKEQGTLIVDKTIKELASQTKQASDFRKKISKGLKADLPEKAEDYVFAFDKELSDLKIGEAEEGKQTLDAAKKAAFKSGIGTSQLNDFVNNYFKGLMESGIIKKPLSEAESELESQKFLKEQKAKLGDNADQIITGTVQWIEQNYKQGIFSESEKEIAMKLVDKDAEHILFFDKFRKMTGEPEVPMTNIKVDGLQSDAEIARNMEQDKYTPEELNEVFKKRVKAGRPETISLEHFSVKK